MIALALLAGLSCAHRARTPVAAGARGGPCFESFAEQLAVTVADRAETYPEGRWAMQHLEDLLKRMQAIAALVEDSRAHRGLLCPVVSRLGDVPPPAELEDPPRCGNDASTRPGLIARWEPMVGSALVGGEVDEAHRWLGSLMRPTPHWGRGTVPPCNCATRFLAATIDATIEEVAREDLESSQRRALLGFAIALDGLQVKANLVDNVGAETQLHGWNVVCAELPGIPSRVRFHGPRALEFSCLDGQGGDVGEYRVMYFDPSDLPTKCRFVLDGQHVEVEVGRQRDVECRSSPETGLTCEAR